MADIVVGPHSSQALPAPGGPPGYGPLAGGVPVMPGYGPLAAGVPQPGGANSSGADWIGILRRRFWLIIGFVSVGVLLSWGVTQFLALNMPEYTASALLSVVNVRQGNIMMMDDPLYAGDSVSNFMNSQALFLESDAVLGEAIVNPDVVNSNWYREVTAKGQNRVTALRKAIKVTPQRNTIYMYVSATTRFKDDSKLLANTVVEAFLNKSRQLAGKEYIEKINALNQEYDRLDRTAREKLEAVSQYRDRTQLQQSDDPSPEIYARFQNVSAYLVQADNDFQKARVMADKYNSPALDLRSDPEIRAMINNDPRVVNYRAAGESLEAEIQRAADRFGPNHNQVKRLKLQLDFVLARRDAEEARQITEFTERLRHQWNQAYQIAADNLLKAKERYEAVYGEVRDYDYKRAQLRKLEQEYLTAQELCNDVARALALMQINRRDPGLRRMDLQAPAEEPSTYSFPDLRVNLVLGVVLSLAMGVGLAFLLERYNKTLRSVDDVTEMGLELLGFLPHIDDEDVDVKEPRLIAQFLPDSMIAEHYRLVRSVIRAKLRQNNFRSLVVLSPQPADGKTSVSINLAISFAHIGVRVLLVEADLRRSVFSKLFNQTKPMGLMDWLSGKTNNPNDVVSTTSLPNLDVISAGTRLANPSEWLETGRLQSLISGLPQYSLIIVDAPPALVVSDGYVLAGQVDGVVLVTRAGVSTRRAVTRMVRELETHNARLLGVVLNAVRVKSREHGYYYGGYYYYRYRSANKGEEPGGVRSLPGDQQSEPADPSPPRA